MKVSKSVAVTLFTELEYETAKNWPLNRFAKKLKELPSVLEEGEEKKVKDKDAKALLKKLTKALDDDAETEITIIDDTSDDENSSDKRSKMPDKSPSKPDKSSKKSSKKAAKEEDEDDDDDDDDEDDDDDKSSKSKKSAKAKKSSKKDDASDEDDGAAAADDDAKAKSKKGKKGSKKAAKDDDDDDDDDLVNVDEEVKKNKAELAKKAGKGSKKDKKSDKKSEGRGAPKGQKKVGIIATIIECLRAASKKSPTTIDEIAKKLAKKFPEKDAAGMRRTVQAQVPYGLRVEKELEVQRDDEKGVWLDD